MSYALVHNMHNSTPWCSTYRRIILHDGLVHETNISYAIIFHLYHLEALDLSSAYALMINLHQKILEEMGRYINITPA